MPKARKKTSEWLAPSACRELEPGLGGIAEVKRRSPSAGDLRPDADPATLAAAAERLRGTILKVFAWMRVRQRLALLYRKIGRSQDTERIEAELRSLLAGADSDFPMLVQLQRSQEKAIAAA